MYKPLKAKMQLKDFGYLISEKIHQKELEIDSLAKEASVNPATILKIISGGNTTMITLFKIADAMSMDLGELFKELEKCNHELCF